MLSLGTGTPVKLMGAAFSTSVDRIFDDGGTRIAPGGPAFGAKPAATALFRISSAEALKS